MSSVLFWPVHSLFIKFIRFSKYLFYYLCSGVPDINPVVIVVFAIVNVTLPPFFFLIALWRFETEILGDHAKLFHDINVR